MIFPKIYTTLVADAKQYQNLRQHREEPLRVVQYQTIFQTLLCDFFNSLMGKITLNKEGTVFYKSVQLLAYVDETD